jgi:hypothetical protein
MSGEIYLVYLFLTLFVIHVCVLQLLHYYTVTRVRSFDCVFKVVYSFVIHSATLWFLGTNEGTLLI